MKDQGKNYIRKLIHKSGNILVPHTPKSEVLSLIKKLRPYKTNFDLIRLGPQGDGGYILPNDLENIEACFSPGVSEISGFEIDCAKKHNMKIFLADNSVDSPNINDSSINYSFIKKHIGSTNNDSLTTIDNWVNFSKISNDSDLLLQMDIESCEYEVLINISDELLKRFRIIIIEFHDLDLLWNPQFFSIAKIAFNKLLQTHKCVHIHPNNVGLIKDEFGIKIPQLAEFTFLRNDRDSFKGHQTAFPNILDKDNSSSSSTITLPKQWYKD